MHFNQTKAHKIARIIGLVLLLAHTLLSLLALWMLLSKGEGAGWWPVFFTVDLPASFPVFWLSRHMNSDGVPFVTFVAIGSIWHFYWPQVLVASSEFIFRTLRKPEGRT